MTSSPTPHHRDGSTSVAGDAPATSSRPRRLRAVLGVTVAAVAAFVAAFIWYVLFADTVMRAQGQDPEAMAAAPPAGLLAVEFARTWIVAAIVASLLTLPTRRSLSRAVGIAFLLWLGFPAMLLLGSVMWENVPPIVAIVHAGDWLLKLVLMTTIVSIVMPARPATEGGRS